MAQKESKMVTDLSYLEFGGTVDRAWFGGEAVMMFFNGIKVFNRAEYTLVIPSEQLLVTADGNPIPIDIDSSKLNYGEKEKETVPYYGEVYDSNGNVIHFINDGEGINLEPNNTKDEKTGTFYIAQSVSEITLWGSYKQLGRVDYYEYYDFIITGVSYLTVPASGTGSMHRRISVSYSYYRVLKHSDGTSETPERKTGWTDSARILNSSVYYDHVSLNTNTGAVYAGNLEDNKHLYDFEIVCVRALEIYIAVDDNPENNTTISWSGTASCYQEYNILSEYRSYSISCSAYPDQFFAIGGESTISVSAYCTIDKSWTSGYPVDSETIEDTAIVSALYNGSSVGSFPYGSTVKGDGSVTFRVPENKSMNPRDIVIMATSSDNSTYDTDTISQYANTEAEWWGEPTVLEILCTLDIPANGMGVPISARYIQYKYKATQTGGSEVIDESRGTVVVDSATVTDSVNGASVSGSNVSAKSLGTTPMGRRAVLKVTSVTITVNGVTNSSSGKSCLVYQQENKPESTSNVYSLGLSQSGSPIPVTGGYATITVDAYRMETTVYTSRESDVSDPIAHPATLSSSGGSLGTSSISGHGTTRLTVSSENYDKTNKSFVVSATCGTVSKSVTVLQAASVYELSWRSIDASVSAAGGTVSLTLISKRNGSAHDITASSVIITGLSGVGVSISNDGGGDYSVILDVPQNPTTEERTFTVKVTQPFSLDETSPLKVTQQRASTPLKVARLMAGFSFNGTDYSKVVVTNARLVATGSDYGGGLVEDLSLRVVNKSTGAIYGNSGNLGDFNVSKGGSVNVPITSLNNNSNSKDNVGVEVWFGSKYQQSFDIVQLDIN